jgi:hypothetical protein
MTDWLNPAQDAALRRPEPPPLSRDFAANVMARLPAAAAPLPQPNGGRIRRRPWQRARNAAVAVAAVGLISISAAASGLFGVTVRNMPVISSLAERIAPKPHIAKPPKADPARPALIKAARPDRAAPVSVPTVEPASLAEPALKLNPEIRREAFAERIVERMERRAVRRAMRGLPPARHPLPPRLREKLRAMAPEDRQALMSRVREMRRQRRLDDTDRAPMPQGQARDFPQQAVPPTLEQIERRRTLRQMRKARRAAGFEPAVE